MADTTFRTVLPPLKAVDLGDGTHAVSSDIADRLNRLLGKITNYDVLVGGTLEAAEETVELATAGLATAGLDVRGTFVATIVVEGTVDGTNWTAIPLITPLLGTATASVAAPGVWLAGCSGWLAIRARMSAWTSGAATIMWEGTSASGATFLARSLPTGVNSIGTVGLNAGTNLIGKVSEPATVETPFTGAGNVVVGTHNIAPGAAFKLIAIELHLSAAPTTGAQNLVITLDDGVAAAYDLNILTLDLVANAIVDLRIEPNLRCKASDVITAAWTNTDARTFGLKFKHQLI